jgi:hypothetical protein
VETGRLDSIVLEEVGGLWLKGEKRIKLASSNNA